jgi:F-type H+-transporting ATPase subunit a
MEHSDGVLLPLRIWNIDLSITAPIAWLLAATIALLAFLLAATSRLTPAPRRTSQNLLETIFEFFQNQILEPANLKDECWAPFVLTLFLFILLNNLVGIIPGSRPATGNINLTAALAIGVFLASLASSIISKGMLGYLKSFAPQGVRGVLLILIYPIEVVSSLTKPLSLAVRLFANLSGGHMLLLTITGFSVLFPVPGIQAVSTLGAAVVVLFEIFVALIQAYVFAFLSALMLGEAVTREHN